MGLGHALDDLTIVPEGDLGGRARSSSGPAFGRSAAANFEQAVVYLSGPAAQGKFPDTLSKACTENDQFGARIQLAGSDDSTAERRMAHAQRWADALTGKWATDVDLLANELLVRRTMLGTEAIAFFGGLGVDSAVKEDLASAAGQ